MSSEKRILGFNITVQIFDFGNGSEEVEHVRAPWGEIGYYKVTSGSERRGNKDINDVEKSSIRWIVFSPYIVHIGGTGRVGTQFVRIFDVRSPSDWESLVERTQYYTNEEFSVIEDLWVRLEEQFR